MGHALTCYTPSTFHFQFDDHDLWLPPSKKPTEDSTLRLTLPVMEGDQTYNNGPAWTFQSPGQTPTSTSFDTSIFQTPKSMAYPSHFQDAFNTPHLQSYNTPQQPEYPILTPQQQQQFMPVETLRSNAYANGQPMVGRADDTGAMDMGLVNGQSNANMPQMSQAYAAQQDNIMVSGNDFHSAFDQNSFAMSFDSSQMQTPPPTGDSSAKRLPPGPHVAFDTPSTIASRRNVTPQQSYYPQQGVQQQQTPVHFPYLPFSPEEYPFANLGPVTAPAMTQGNVLWAQSSPTGMYPQQNLLADPFAPAHCESMMWPSMNATAGVQGVAFDTPAMVEFPTMAPHQIPMSATSVVPSSRPSTMSGAVDPALLFDSSRKSISQQRDLSQMSQSNAGALTAADTARRASATEDANSSTVHTHFDVSSAAARLPSANRPGLRRSNTTGTMSVLQQQHQHIPARTGSPLKRGGLPLTSITETSAAAKKPRQRTSVMLMIDESGRARTESRPLSASGKVDSPTQSARAKYPGLFDSDSEDSDDEANDAASDASSASIAARNASFHPQSRPHASAGHQSKAGPYDRSSSVVDDDDAASTIPSRSSSSASNRVAPSRAAIAAVAQLRRASSLKRSQKRNSIAGSSFAFSTADSSMLFGETYGPLPTLSHQGATLEDHNRRWSTLSLGQQQRR
ncbi:uncharacterized protein K489DRAFT_397420 [Dissoconium aciculare CBS 342.82]|uniref:Uncharacterized protein n=1 Tax=Dissoconium aciculare CBS 342.82 TaxID=1314786 RepID=A0A6J3MHA9_9PEZI|nr:uncharacterized protein K489DRAFT_397420 [Dissoconium aciculare CBS 342.82]KAF1827079.1 hypothetical protein K489DRAFT_397420 [Dissoconium aciculare CBS 342.82]